MDNIRNPFAPDAGTRPPELAGRDDVLEDARVALTRILAGRSARSLMMTGLRGTGKTVLLTTIESMAEERGYQTSFIEAPEDKPFPQQVAREAKSALLRLSNVEKAKALARDALGVLASFISSVRVQHGEVSVGVEPKAGFADSGDLEKDLSDLFLAVGRCASSAETGWALLVDEIQYLDEASLSALIVALHRANQRNAPIFFAGAGLPQIARLAGEAKSYAERLFAYRIIGKLDPEAARNAIRKPILEEEEAIEDDALEEIVKRTEGYPYFLQEWGYHAWSAASCSPISLADALEAEKRALRRLDQGFFRVRFDRLTAREVEIVEAMSRLGRGPYSISDVATALGVKLQSISPHRSNLISKGMIYAPERSYLDFTVPMFDEFLRRNQAKDGPAPRPVQGRS